MRKITVLLAGLAVAIALGCKKDEAEKPKVSYKENARTTALQEDSPQIQIADLPIHIQGTNVLLHPIGNYRVDGKRKAAYGYEKGSFTISNFSEFQLTGYLQNIKFQEIGSDSIRSLIDKPVLIQTATFLKVLADKTKQQVMVYTLADMDTNQDGNLDASDIQSLYLSEMNGTKLTKISADYQELIDWNLIEAKSRLYFRTIEDTNKNGEFDKNDVLHYHYVDMANPAWKVENYSPVN
ncbi:MAG TPA: hypothetical protein VF581_10335 [Flavobacterium sp.]|jgi:hypothetical protein